MKNTKRQKLIGLLKAIEAIKGIDRTPAQGRMMGELTEEIIALDPTDLEFLKPTPNEVRTAVAAAKKCGAW